MKIGQKPQSKPISFDIRSECAETKKSIHIEIDSKLKFRVVNKRVANERVANEDADLRIYIPVVDFAKLKAPSIIDDF